MKEPYTEGVANHCGPELCADSRGVIREASEITSFFIPTH